MIGLPVVFVRTGGCDYRCSWCDTDYAVLPEFREQWTSQTGAEVLDKIKALTQAKPIWVVVSGGNPALQPLAQLLTLGQAAGYKFALETQGSVYKEWFSQLDQLVVSPKPPSANISTDLSVLDQILNVQYKVQAQLKIPVLDDTDFAFAQSIHARYPTIPITLQPVNNTPDATNNHTLHSQLMQRMRWLQEKINQAQWYEARLLPQLHVLMWGTERGV
jgi:7-carboxy-7-deazaguanine synthase